MINKRRILMTLIFGALLLLLYLFIFSFSAQSGEESGSLSQKISQGCVEFINSISGGGWSEEFKNGLAEYFEHPIRKAAHFSEYAYMAVLLYGVWSQWIQRGRKLNFLILIWVFASAAMDELHQLFVPGRCGSFADVALDTAGGAAGLLFCIGVVKILVRHTKRDCGTAK